MRVAQGKTGRVGKRGIGHFDVEEKVLVSREMPDRFTVFFIDDEDAEQAESALELENEKITRLEVLRHTEEVSINALLPLKSSL